MTEENWKSLLCEVNNVSEEDLKTIYDEAIADSEHAMDGTAPYVFVPAKGEESDNDND